MKNFFFTVTLVILCFSAAFMGYGVYLNRTSNSYIETVMASRAISLTGVRVSSRDLYPRIYLDYVNLQTKMDADVIARIDGRIDELYVTQGQDVEQGQQIARIVNDDVPLSISRANVDVAKAEAAYQQSVSTVERNQRLAAEDAIAASDLEMSISQMKASKADLDAAKIAKTQAENQSGFQVVTAPLSGSVLLIYQRPGNFVSQGTPLVMIADFSRLFFTALIDDRKINNIAPIEGKYTLHMDLDNMTEKAFDSTARSSFGEGTAFGVTISGVSPPIGESAPVRSVMFEVDNRLGVMEIGLYTDIVIRKETSKRALVIPQDAVFDPDEPKVYVRDADSNLAVRGIRLGVYDDKYVEVLEGLGEGDVVITSGVEGLDPGMRIEVNLEENL